VYEKAENRYPWRIIRPKIDPLAYVRPFAQFKKLNGSPDYNATPTFNTVNIQYKTCREHLNIIAVPTDILFNIFLAFLLFQV